MGEKLIRTLRESRGNFLRFYTSNAAVTWSVSGAGCSGAACGTISGGGLYTAPMTVPSPATLNVTATSMRKYRRRNKLKSKVLSTIRGSLAVLGALEMLMLRVFAFAALTYLLFRMIR